MKDLYTFDYTTQEAEETYDEVRAAYIRIFQELSLPVVMAEASSGDMGGSFSHEFHLPASIGEDRVVSCASCGYTANDEVAKTRASPTGSKSIGDAWAWRGISKDRMTLINVWVPAKDLTGKRTYLAEDVNLAAIRTLIPDLDTGVSDAVTHWAQAVESLACLEKPPSAQPFQLVNIIDHRLSQSVADGISAFKVDTCWPSSIPRPSSLRMISLTSSPDGNGDLDTLRAMPGDSCPRCESGVLDAYKAIEVGHTFQLGTRYSAPLSASVVGPKSSAASSDRLSGPTTTEGPSEAFVEMGCHGIGVTRLMGAIAHHLADSRGLNWPAAIAPYEVVIIPGSKVAAEDLIQVYDTLSSGCKMNPIGVLQGGLDVIMDDRDASLPWKLNDADAAGFPVVVVLGKAWLERRQCEVQCRRLSRNVHVELSDLADFTRNLLDKL